LRILLLNQFYPPDVAPTGRFLHDLATTLVERGHTVRVVCSRRAYATGDDLGPGGSLDGVEVRRVPSLGRGKRSLAARFADDAAFLIRAASLVLTERPRPDLMVAMTSPPLVGLPVALASRGRGIRYAQWTMDLYPDVLDAHGVLTARSMAASALERIGRLQFHRAALVLTIGPYMGRRVARHLDNGALLETVPLWSELGGGRGGDVAHSVEAVRTRRGWNRDDLVLLYSGNMGRGHRFGEFLEAARRLGAGSPVWAFIGDGPQRREVEQFVQQHPSARVQLLPYVPAADLAASHQSADAHLVSLSSAWQGVIVPSKLQAAFSVGRPVIFVGPAQNEIADWIRDSRGGWVVEEGDVDGVIRAIQELRDPGERLRRGEAARAFAQAHFDRRRNCSRIADLLEGCASTTK
jgi:colanic acid biosynthesis glycosyl transferase WcaI